MAGGLPGRIGLLVVSRAVLAWKPDSGTVAAPRLSMAGNHVMETSRKHESVTNPCVLVSLSNIRRHCRCFLTWTHIAISRQRASNST